MKNKQNLILNLMWVVIAVLISAMAVLAVLAPNVQNILTSEEEKLAMTYPEFTDEDYAIDDCDNVRFLAFFERDINRDGLSEKYAGTTKSMSDSDTLYLDINVLTDGTFKDGVVTFSNDSNFNYSMNMIKDTVLSRNYVSSNVKKIEFNDINAGTQELIVGGISPNKNVSNYYSKVTTVTLTGTYVPSDANAQPIAINKTIDLTVDWYGRTKTTIDSRNYTVSKEWLPEEDKVSNPEININFSTMENLKQLLIKNTTVTVQMPLFNGHYPTDVYATGGTYNKDNHTLTISRNSILDENDNLVSSVSSKNSYYITIAYPDSAYRELYEEWKGNDGSRSATINLVFRIWASYTGYNNPNYSESTSSASGISTVIVKIGADDPKPGPEAYINVYFKDRQKIGRNNWDNSYGIEKQPIRDAWYSEEDRAYYYVLRYSYRWNGNGTDISDGYIEIETPQADKIGEYDLYHAGSCYAIYGNDFTSLVNKGSKIYVYNVEHNTEGVNSSWNGDTVETLVAKYGDGDTIEAIPNVMNAEEYAAYLNKMSEPLGDTSKMENLQFLNPRNTSVQDIKIKITDIQSSGNFDFYVIKKIDCSLLSTFGYTSDQLENANSLSSYIYSNLNYDEDSKHLHSEDANIVKLVDLKSYANIGLSNSHFEPGEEDTHRDVYIRAGRLKFGDATWQDGIFVVEFPESIINMEVNDIEGQYMENIGGAYTNRQMTIKGWNLDKDNNKYYLKILAENLEEVEELSLNIDANMIVDPRPGITTLNNIDNTVKLYYENDIRKYYYDSTRDILDINGNINYDDLVGLATVDINIASPTSMVTFQTVSNYDTNESITVAPNIAEISKDVRSAKVNLYVINGYRATITDTMILGKVPYENNKYVLSPDKYMGSDFSAKMQQGGITVPEEIRENTVVYYSEVGEPTKDLTNAANGWKTADQVTDWSLIKSYLIDLSAISLNSGIAYEFSYNVSVPEGLNYNDKSFATHAIYYKYQAQSGAFLEQETEPTKVGIRVAKKYNLETVKYKEATNRFVPNAIYKLKEYNSVNDVMQEKTLVTNDLGAINLKNLYVNAEYTLEEISSPSEYLLNNNVIRFKVVENGDTLGVETLSTTGFRGTPTVNENEGVFTVSTEVEDAPKYQINITYIDSSINQPIPNAVIQVNDEMYVTNSEGKVSIDKLLPNGPYNITEIKVDGCKLENHEFELDKDGNTYTLTTDMTTNENSIVYDETDQIQVNVTVNKQSAARFNLEVVKVEKDDETTDLFGMTKLLRAVFSLNSEDNSLKNVSLTTDSNGVANISNIYQYDSSLEIPGEYTLREEVAPDGYVLNQEAIKFKVKTENDELKVEIENQEALTSIKDVKIDGTNVTLVIQDSPYFKLTKTDSRTGEPLEGVKFAIYELEEIKENGVGTGEYNKVGFAKDVIGNYVGTQNDDGIYVVTTDSKGEIKLLLKDGIYQIEEIEALPGYVCDRVERFQVKNGVTGTENNTGSGSESGNTTGTETVYTFTEPATTGEPVVIGTVDQLKALSTAVAGGDNYSGKKVVLSADLDFTGVTEFTPIGSAEHPFSGVFDGANYKIQNVSLEGEGLAIFGFLENATIENLGVTGSITGTNDVAGIALKAIGTVKFSNCYNSATLSAKNAAGILLYGAGDIELYNCYNTGAIGGTSSTLAAGIVGKIDSALLNNTTYMNTPQKFIAYECHNDGNITGSTSTNDYFAGIIAHIDGDTGTKHDFDQIDIVKCYNSGNITAKRSAGIVSYMDLSNTSDLVINVKECDNTGYVESSPIIGQIYQYSGNNATYNIDKCNNNYSGENKSGTGLMDNLYSYINGTSTINITNCNNNGNIDGSLGYRYDGYYGGILGDAYISKGIMNISNCTNKGNIENCSYNAGGIVGKIYFSNDGGAININNVKNEGNITSTGGQIAGIIGYYSVSGSTSTNIINNAINTGNIESTSSSIGGIIGLSDMGSSAVQLSNCYNTANVSGSSSTAGLIGKTSRPVTFTKCYNTGNIASSSNYGGYIGGLLGYFENSYKYEITDCYNTGDISGYENIGGLVGLGYTSQNSKIDNSYNTGNITGKSYNLGGILGKCQDSSGLYVKILNTYNTGTVSIGNNTLSNSGYIGGIVGQGSCEYENCSNKGNIQINNSTSEVYIGGIVGYGQYSKIRNCVNYGDISCKSSSRIHAGGIIAYGCDVQDSYNYGNITAISTSSDSGYVGGISGLYGTSTGEGIINVFNKGNILTNNAKYTGGIAGALDDKPIEKAYNSGKITGLGNSGSSEHGTGGIVGRGWSSNISDCYNEGNILGTDYVGGIVGYAQGSSTNYKNLYNIGNVASNKNGTVGAIIGTEKVGKNGYNTYNSLENAYYLDTIKLNSGNVLDNGTAKTWNQMISDEFYTALNVDNVWVKRNNKAPTFNYSLPIVGTPTELKITNDKEEYIISTAVLGTGGTISGQGQAIYETVTAGENSREVISATPSTGYVLTSLSVNGESLGFTTDDNGIVTLPEGFFKNMDENKVVVASFAEEDKIVTIHKTDSETNEPLEGAKFKISNYQGDWDTFKATKTALATSKIGTLTASATAASAFTTDANGHYVSTNTAHNSLSSSYIPIDLTELSGTYKLTVDSVAGSRSGDHGYVTIKETTDTPNYSDSNGRIIDAEYDNHETGRTLLQGGKMYYLHMGYKKDGSDASWSLSYSDKFTINSITIELDDSSKVDEYVTTDSNGNTTFTTTDDSFYYTEVTAPTGYRIDSESHECVIANLTNGTLNVTNQALPKVIAHYYLKEGDVYTTKKLAEDTIYRGNVGDDYQAEIKAIEGFDLEVDADGEYVLPNNIKGKFGTTDENVNFYYVPDSIDLTIHHYKEGTLTKLANDETVSAPVVVTFDETNGTYTLSVDKTYVIANNESYIDLISNQNFSLIDVDSTNSNDLKITDTLLYNEDTVLTYSYDNKDYTIKTRVEKHTESVINDETSLPETVMVAGGTISGEDMIVYESVNANQNATKDIAISANTGYVIDTITVITTDDDGNKTSQVVYGTGKSENPEITCEGTKSNITLSKFQNMQGDKEVVVKFAIAISEAKIVEKYVDVNENDEEVTHIDHFYEMDQEYEITPNAPEGYVVLTEDADGNSLLPDNASGTVTKEEDVVEFKVAKKAKVTVKYITDVEGEDPLADDVTINGYEGKSYTTEAIDVEGYELIAVPENASGTMTVTDQTSETIVTYIYRAKTPAKVIVKYIDINKDVVVDTEEKTGYVGDSYTVTPKEEIKDALENEYVIIAKDKDDNDILPINTEGNMTAEDTIVTYYVAKKADIRVQYINKETTAKVKVDTVIEGYEGKEYKVEPVEINGYELLENETIGITEGDMPAGETVITYYYKQIVPEVITVRAKYVEKDTNTKLAEDEVYEGPEGETYTTTAKEIKDYELVRVPTNATGTLQKQETDDGEVVNEIIVIYEYKEKARTKVVEKYVDINTDEVVEEKDHEGHVGDSYEIKPNVKDGYVLIEEPDNSKGEMTEEVIEVVYKVAKEAKVIVRYIVKYDGVKIAEDIVIEGYEGKDYKVEGKEIDGYELIEVVGQEEGKMKAGDNVITYYYAEILEGIIPQTGSHVSNIFLYVMASIVIIVVANIGVAVVYKFKK